MAQEPLVLLLEDEFLIATVTGEILEDRGFAVMTAGSTTEAMRILNDLNEELSAFFVDIHMRDGSTSFEVAHAARRRFPDVAVLYTSGLPDAGCDERCVPKSQFIGKPYDTSKAAEILRTMIDEVRQEYIELKRA